MSWFKRKPISERPLTEGELEAYLRGYSDGVGIVIDKLTSLDPDTQERGAAGADPQPHRGLRD